MQQVRVGVRGQLRGRSASGCGRGRSSGLLAGLSALHQLRDGLATISQDLRVSRIEIDIL